MAKVSVLLTTYNRPQFLRRAIESVVSQTFQDYELLILDDNSDNEKQKELIKSYWNHSKVIVVKSNVSNEDRHALARYSVMINMGLSLAEGEYVTYLCDDDYYMDNRLQVMVDYLDVHPEVQVVYGAQKLLDMNHDGETVDAKTSKREATEIKKHAGGQVDHSSVMHRMKIVEMYGGWPTSKKHWGEGDAAFWIKMTGNGHYFYPVGDNKTLDVHVYHEGSWTKGDNFKTISGA